MGSGKSAVADIIRQMGFAVLSADDVAREVVKPGTPGLGEVVADFGPDILDANGQLNRRILGQIVFQNPDRLRRLEAILHPKIRDWVRDWRDQAAQQGRQVAFYEVPLLFEKQMEDQFDAIICVTAPQEFVLQRIRKRDGLSDVEIQKRWQQQIPDAIKVKKSQFVIANNGTFQDLKHAVEQVVVQITSPKSSQN